MAAYAAQSSIFVTPSVRPPRARDSFMSVSYVPSSFFQLAIRVVKPKSLRYSKPASGVMATRSFTVITFIEFAMAYLKFCNPR